MAVTVTRTFSGEEKTFPTYTALWRWIVANNPQAGHHRTVGHFYLGTLNHRGQVGASDLYWANQRLGGWTVTADQLHALLRLQNRYRTYVHHLTEVLPEWRETGRIPWMDNSVDVIETNKWGCTRRRQIVAPHGDLC